VTRDRETRLWLTLCAVTVAALMVLAILETVGAIHAPG
jgi:hypothetical protein